MPGEHNIPEPEPMDVDENIVSEEYSIPEQALNIQANEQPQVPSEPGLLEQGLQGEHAFPNAYDSNESGDQYTDELDPHFWDHLTGQGLPREQTRLPLAVALGPGYQLGPLPDASDASSTSGDEQDVLERETFLSLATRERLEEATPQLAQEHSTFSPEFEKKLQLLAIRPDITPLFPLFKVVRTNRARERRFDLESIFGTRRTTEVESATELDPTTSVNIERAIILPINAANYSPADWERLLPTFKFDPLVPGYGFTGNYGDLALRSRFTILDWFRKFEDLIIPSEEDRIKILLSKTVCIVEPFLRTLPDEVIQDYFIKECSYYSIWYIHGLPERNI